MNNKKNIVIGALIGVIMLMGIGYAALAQVLNINGKANISGSWDVEITGITAGTMTGAASVGNPTFDATSATFETNLEYPGATATYVVTIENKGTIDAKLSSISGLDTFNAAAPTGVTATLTGVTANSVLEAGESTTATVTITWADTDTIPTQTTKTAAISFNYVQNT